MQNEALKEKINIIADSISKTRRKHKNKWYFWNETWSDRFGPFNTKEKAEKELDFYAFILNQPKKLPKSV